MSLGDFKKLLGLQGMELLDFSAQLVGKPQPSTLADPLLSPEPVLLDGAIDEWQKAADGMTFRLSEFEQQVTLVLQAWQAPPEFLTYTSSVADVMEAQQAAMQEVKKLLEDVKKGLDDDKKATQRKIENVCISIMGVLFGAGAALVAGLLFPPAEAAIAPAAWTAVIGGIGALIGGLIAWLVASRQNSEDRADSWKETLDDLKELSEGRQLEKIKSPSMPDLSNVKSFRLITS